MLEKTLESPLDCKIKPVNPEGNQSWIFTRRADAEAEAPILWPLDKKNWLIRKDLDTGKDWGQEEKGATGNEMVGWHHRLDGHESEQTPGVGDGQGSLTCSVHGVAKSRTQLSNWTELWPSKRVGEAGRGQIITGLHGFTKELGLYPKVNREWPINFQQAHMTRFTLIRSFHLVCCPFLSIVPTQPPLSNEDCRVTQPRVHVSNQGPFLISYSNSTKFANIYFLLIPRSFNL